MQSNEPRSYRPTAVKRPARSQRGQASLIGLLVAIAIILILAATIYPRYLAKHHKAGEGATPIERANDVACGIYVGQVRDAISEYRQDNGMMPPNLDALKRYGVTRDMYASPDCTLTYDPQTGRLGSATSGVPGISGMGGGEGAPVIPSIKLPPDAGASGAAAAGGDSSDQ